MNNIHKLIDILECQAKIYTDLLAVSKNKTDVIIEGKVNELESITRLEQTLVLNMGPLEDELEKVVNDLISELKINEENINITTILEHLEGEQKEELEKQRDIIYNMIQQLNEANKLNSQLIKKSLDYINFSVNLYSNVNSSSNGTYQSSGDINGNKSSFFDKKL